MYLYRIELILTIDGIPKGTHGRIYPSGGKSSTANPTATTAAAAAVDFRQVKATPASLECETITHSIESDNTALLENFVRAHQTKSTLLTVWAEVEKATSSTAAPSTEVCTSLTWSMSISR